MAKHTQTIRRQIADELFECLTKLVLKALRSKKNTAKKVHTKLGSNKIIFIDRCPLIPSEPFI